MNRRFFGTDGVRGLAGEEPLTPEIALALGRAVARQWRDRAQRPRIVVGRDTRLSGDMLEAAFCSGLCAAGADAVLLGVLPTPAVAYLTRAIGAQAGAVISASHNPFQDNGIKLFSADGFKLSDAVEWEIEQGLSAAEVQAHHATGEQIGRIHLQPDAGERYLDHVRSSLGKGARLDGLKVVVDAGQGAAFALAPRLLTELGAQVIAMGITPDGRNINAGSGALHPQPLQRAVVEHNAQLGVALDGDADRAILVDEHGEVRDGDACLALCGTALLRAGRLPGHTVVATQMSNLGLELYFKRLGISLLRTQVGDRYVVDAMRAGHHPLGGEQSGHVIFLEHGTTGDGLLTAAKVAMQMVEQGQSLSELLEGLERLPQVLLNVRLRTRKPLDELPSVRAAIRRVENVLGSDGRVLVRFSGTEPLCRVMLEGKELSKITTLAQEIVDEIALELA